MSDVFSLSLSITDDVSQQNLILLSDKYKIICVWRNDRLRHI